METMKPREVSKEAARRFLVLRQALLQEEGKSGTLKAIKHLECVQTDPINVVHRNQHLVLHNRVKDYRLSYLEELLYKDRLAFEYWCNEKSVIPIEDFPYFRYRMKNPSQFHSPFYERIKAKRKELKDVISYVVSEIRNQGPLSAREFGQKGKIKGKVATSVLNLLWDCGDLMIHHKEGNRRYYDLTERVLPPKILNKETPTREEYERFIIRKYMKAYGLVDTRNWRFGWLPMKASQRKTIVREMVKNKKLIPVKIESVKHIYYVLEENLGLFDFDEPISEKAHFLAPLDNLLWNRRMVSEIFDFNYAWEVYKVPEKRIYGYYVMPILYGTRFVGRLDPKLDRRQGEMILNSLILEEKDLNKNFVSELAETLQRFLKFHNVSRVSIRRTQPTELKEALMGELNGLNSNLDETFVIKSEG
jgi:hypothetical protein